MIKSNWSHFSFDQTLPFFPIQFKQILICVTAEREKVCYVMWKFGGNFLETSMVYVAVCEEVSRCSEEVSYRNCAYYLHFMEVYLQTSSLLVWNYIQTTYKLPPNCFKSTKEVSRKFPPNFLTDTEANILLFKNVFIKDTSVHFFLFCCFMCVDVVKIILHVLESYQRHIPCHCLALPEPFHQT